MKRGLCFFVIVLLGFSLYAFDRSLNGSWGIITSDEKEEIIRFNTNEIIVIGERYGVKDIEEGEDTIYIEDLGASIVIQYYLLSANKLLFIMWDADDPTQSMTLILSRL